MALQELWKKPQPGVNDRGFITEQHIALPIRLGQVLLGFQLALMHEG